MSKAAKQDEATKQDEAQQQAVEDSFPASDPPAQTPTRGAGTTPGRPHPEAGNPHEDEDHSPRGQPTDDRLASETASARVQGVHPPQTDHR